MWNTIESNKNNYHLDYRDKQSYLADLSENAAMSFYPDRVEAARLLDSQQKQRCE